jgi:dipeptidyl aminopeptidase/acylaminoacyl peptidase
MCRRSGTAFDLWEVRVSVNLVRRFLFAAVVVAALMTTQIVPVAALAGVQEEEPRVLSAEDTLRLNSVGSARISPDDQWVLYTKSIRDMEDEELSRTTHIWRVRIDGTQRRQLTHGEESASSPAWFPSGEKIAFTSSRGEGEGNQIFFMYVDGGEAWQATEHEGGVSQFHISPDGAKVLFTAQDPLSEEQKKKREMKDDAEVVDAEFRMTHLWVFDIESGEETRLTEGDFTIGDPQWSPDSSQIAYVTRPTPKVDDASYTDIWVVDAAGGEARKLYDNVGPDSSPRWSPDGTTIAFAANTYEGTSTWYSSLYVIPAAGGEPEIYLEDFDLDFGSPIWSRDGSSIYWSTGQGTTINLFAIDLGSREVDTYAVPTGANGGWALSHDGGRWVYSHSGPASPGELYTAPLDFSGPVQLTDANPWLREEGVQFGTTETIRWQNSDGQWIEGVLAKPVGYVEGQSYPLVVNPHGGPSGARIESFDATNQFFAGNGFAVFQPNFRGSSNYGQEFLNANRDYWGIRDYDDIMTGVDYLIAEGIADPDRMVAYGWSYGGYMTFWMCTQTDRFKLISPGAGLSNLYSMYSTTDIPAYLAWFFGTPWDNEDIYRQLSPIRHVKNVTTPILIMHGGNDARVPPEQAVEFYQALKDLGKEVTFVRYPRQGHGIGEPRLQMDRLRRYIYAFSEAVGVTPISEKKWEEEKKKAQEEKDKAKNEIKGYSGIEDVDLAPSKPEAPRADLGIFKVIESEGGR